MTEEEVACLGKTRFLTRRAAKRRANQIRREGGPAMRPYDCDFCPHFHVGHRPGQATYMRHGIPLQETQP
ncbi:hypothetical protein D0Z67_29380 (plasmid) [Streptomyces seoulensis]|uniref:Uncharacterized protein n=1 Tax=Streptomyces seoulensis TaxID=73044 RepID=A0A4P6U597_STRSO|nr:hypothetical protein [Streptomyces seoulensis]QBJ94482.1 hypothetical protein D0Z67_29380 [Streptomyces seoulensis]